MTFPGPTTVADLTVIQSRIPGGYDLRRQSAELMQAGRHQPSKDKRRNTHQAGNVSVAVVAEKSESHSGTLLVGEDRELADKIVCAIRLAVSFDAAAVAWPAIILVAKKSGWLRASSIDESRQLVADGYATSTHLVYLRRAGVFEHVDGNQPGELSIAADDACQGEEGGTVAVTNSSDRRHVPGLGCLQQGVILRPN